MPSTMPRVKALAGLSAGVPVKATRVRSPSRLAIGLPSVAMSMVVAASPAPRVMAPETESMSVRSSLVVVAPKAVLSLRLPPVV